MDAAIAAGITVVGMLCTTVANLFFQWRLEKLAQVRESSRFHTQTKVDRSQERFDKIMEYSTALLADIDPDSKRAIDHGLVAKQIISTQILLNLNDEVEARLNSALTYAGNTSKATDSLVRFKASDSVIKALQAFAQRHYELADIKTESPQSAR